MDQRADIDLAGHPGRGSDDLPLDGLRVIELHAIGPVPYAGMVLRQLGAQVTRVSPPQDPGLGLMMAPEYDLLNRDKQALLLDLKDPAGQQLMAEQLAEADVLLEGFRPGVMERLGLDPAILLQRHPRLVIGRLSGWGDQGPLAARAGHDINYLALTGVLNAVGNPHQPMPPMNLVADFGGGAMHLLVGVLARLVRRGMVDRGGAGSRDSTVGKNGTVGKGGLVTTSIAAGTVGLTPMIYGLLAAGQWRLQRETNLLDGGAPFYRTYACADGRFVAVGALEPKFYRELLDVTGLAGELNSAEQYAEAGWPLAARLFTARFAERSRDDWASASAHRDCCLTPVLDFLEAAAHPHLLANGWFGSGPFAAPQPVIRFDAGA